MSQKSGKGHVPSFEEDCTADPAFRARAERIVHKSRQNVGEQDIEEDDVGNNAAFHGTLSSLDADELFDLTPEIYDQICESNDPEQFAAIETNRQDSIATITLRALVQTAYTRVINLEDGRAPPINAGPDIVGRRYYE